MNQEKQRENKSSEKLRAQRQRILSIFFSGTSDSVQRDFCKKRSNKFYAR